MTWKEWAFRNVRHHRRDLTAYLFSCTLAVALFFLCLQILLHPELVSDHHQAFFITALFLLIVFAAGFIGLSHHRFYRERKEEWELLRALGMGAGDFTRILLWENGFLAGGSILAGMAGGVLLTPLFYVGISFVLFLPETLSIHLSWNAALWTTAMFALLFAGATWRVRRRLIRDRTPLKRFFRIRIPHGVGVVISLVCVGGLGWWTDIQTWTEWIPRLPVIVLSAVLGGYGLLRYGGAWMLERVRVRPFLLRNPSFWLLLPRLRHDWPRDARLLTLVAWMMAAAVGMGSVCFVFWGQADQMARQQNPWTIQVVGAAGKEPAQEVERVLADEGLSVQQKMSLPMLTATIGEIDYTLVSSRDFNRLLRLWSHEPFQVRPGEGVHVFPFEGEPKTGVEDTISVHVGAESWNLDVIQRSDVRVFNQHPRTEWLLVMAESDFREAWEQFRKERRWIYGWQASPWKKSAGAVERLESQWQKEGQLADTPVQGRESIRQASAPMMFLSLFLSLLFFLASATLLTFRLRQGVMREPERWRLLGEWGVTGKQRWRIIQWEVRLLFTLPWLLTGGYVWLINRFFDSLFPGVTVATVTLVFLLQTGLWWLLYLYLWGKFVWWVEEKREEGERMAG
ncbi:ABC transporter permease [Desmospora profundinema]|uniref:ABC transport system permease protein n=1 Tax=Desmospora profundinema TaxID=1571184 RepID=A0ABU1IQ51_9BACL|nr:ABC transporter permease [Desmospora profundinema]MDR6226903.1 putative ABC transport system permease protein [Desmospora profundinema]